MDTRVIGLKLCFVHHCMITITAQMQLIYNVNRRVHRLFICTVGVHLVTGGIKERNIFLLTLYFQSVCQELISGAISSIAPANSSDTDKLIWTILFDEFLKHFFVHWLLHTSQQGSSLISAMAKSAVSRKRREFCRFLTFQERQKTALGPFWANSGLSCKVKAFAFDATVTRNVIKSKLAKVSGLEAQNQGKINLIPSYQ